MIVKELLKRQHPSQGRAQGLDKGWIPLITSPHVPQFINNVYVSIFDRQSRARLLTLNFLNLSADTNTDTIRCTKCLTMCVNCGEMVNLIGQDQCVVILFQCSSISIIVIFLG